MRQNDVDKKTNVDNRAANGGLGINLGARTPAPVRSGRTTIARNNKNA